MSSNRFGVFKRSCIARSDDEALSETESSDDDPCPYPKRIECTCFSKPLSGCPSSNAKTSSGRQPHRKWVKASLKADMEAEKLKQQDLANMKANAPTQAAEKAASSLLAETERKKQEARSIAKARRLAEEARRLAEEARRLADTQRLAEARRLAEEARRLAEEARRRAEEAQRLCILIITAVLTCSESIPSQANRQSDKDFEGILGIWSANAIKSALNYIQELATVITPHTAGARTMKIVQHEVERLFCNYMYLYLQPGVLYMHNDAYIKIKALESYMHVPISKIEFDKESLRKYATAWSELVTDRTWYADLIKRQTAFELRQKEIERHNTYPIPLAALRAEVGAVDMSASGAVDMSASGAVDMSASEDDGLPPFSSTNETGDTDWKMVD